ncbi:MAG: IspD/TarI family cytidylyltransferase [Planctomycetota bacterium]
MINTTVILPAAGLGSRFAVGDKASASKIEFELRHKPVFLRTIDLFHGRLDVGQIILAVHQDKLDDFKFRWADQLGFLGVKLIAGGKAERWQTVQIALDHVADDATHIAIHDAARPCVPPEMIDRVFSAAERLDAVVPGLRMSDTVKRAAESENSGDRKADPIDTIFSEEASGPPIANRITETVPRHDLYRVQTPQVFERGLIASAYAKLSVSHNDGITDDANVAERAGHEVFIVEGDPLNLKLTHPADAELLEAVLGMRDEKDAKASAVKQLFGDDEDE